MATTEKKTVSFDYEETKSCYLQKRHFKKFANKESIEKTIENIQNGTSDMDNFVVIKGEGGKPKLCKKVEDKFVEVVAIEDMFDLVLEKHLECHHGNVELTHSLLLSKYLVHRICVEKVIDSCNVCRDLNEKVKEKVEKYAPVKTVWRMNIVLYRKSRKKSSLLFNYLLILKENLTNFVVLRPLRSNTEELCMELLKIFLEFGPPAEVYVPGLVKYYQDIFKQLNIIWPKFKATVQEAPDSSDIFTKDTDEVLLELNKWAKETECNNFDVGCYIVQYRLNTTRKQLYVLKTDTASSGIPFEMFFGPGANVNKYMYKDTLRDQDCMEVSIS